MRALVLALLFSPLAAAQGSITDDDAQALSERLGEPWDEVAASVPPPAAGTLVGGFGTLRWTVTDSPGSDITMLDAHVVRGTLVAISGRTETEAGRAELREMARGLREAYGSPKADGSYSASQMGQSFMRTPRTIHWLAIRPAKGVVTFGTER